MFVGAFVGLTVFCTAIFYYAKGKTESTEDAAFVSFQRSYLVVYLLGVAGDWLQGPHVYALYESYGMSKHQIEILFIAGFGSSMLFGTVVGSIADKFGRRANVLLYAILYGGACVTKHFASMEILMIGRLLGGIATSILFSAFESWLVFEHNKRGFSESLLGTVFSHAALGNSVVAIVAGVVAQFFADQFGFVAPFDLALTVLSFLFVITVKTWPENYGDVRAPVLESFYKAAHTIRSDVKVQCLGLVQSLFEGAMYTFVLEWTPALSKANTDGTTIPHGLIFASFMLSAMIGSNLFKLLCKHHRAESFMRWILLTSSVCLTIPVLFPDSLILVFSAFLVFEVCVGVFWPAMGFQRSIYVPEESRSTTLNLFRIPLNFIVVFILLQDYPMKTIFEFCALFLFLASLAQQMLYSNAPPPREQEKVPLENAAV